MKDRIKILQNKLLAIKFMRFLLSGGLAFVVDTTILISIKTIFLAGSDLKLFDTISIPKLISGSVGILVMFSLSRLWVFVESKDKSLKKQGAKYSMVTIVNLFIASILYSFYSSLLKNAFAEYQMHVSLFTTFANLLAESTKMLISFFAYKYLVFS